MPFLAAIPLILGGIGAGAGVISAIKGKKSSSNTGTPIDPQMQQVLDLQKHFAEYGFPAAQKNFGKAEGGYDFSLDFYKKILTGSDDEILNLLNAGEYTKSADQSNALASGLMGRNGARAASLSNSQFDRQGVLQGILEQIRLGAPDKISGIAQGYGNLGSQQAGLATGTAQGVSNIVFGQQQLAQQAADRRANLIASIIGAAGSIAGGIAAGRN